MKNRKIKLVESVISKIVMKVLMEQETYDALINRMQKSSKFVKFASHRAREKAERILGTLPKYRFYSLWYEGQYYPMDEKSISKILDISGVQVVNKLPKDLSKWSLAIDRH